MRETEFARRPTGCGICQAKERSKGEVTFLKQDGWLLRAEQYGTGLPDRMVKCCQGTCGMAPDKAVLDDPRL